MAIGISFSCTMIAVITLLQYAELDLFSFFGWLLPLYQNPRMRMVGTLGNPNFVTAVIITAMPMTWALARVMKKQLFGLLLNIIHLMALIIIT